MLGVVFFSYINSPVFFSLEVQVAAESIHLAWIQEPRPCLSTVNVFTAGVETA